MYLMDSAKRKRVELEEAIDKLINTFEAETDLKVSGMGFKAININMSGHFRCWIAVRLPRYMSEKNKRNRRKLRKINQGLDNLTEV